MSDEPNAFTADKPEPAALTIIPQGKTIFTISWEGRAKLSDDIDLSDLRAMPRDFLLGLREMINTALYDQERGK